MKKIVLIIGIILVTMAIVLTGVLYIQGKTYNVQKPIATIEIEGYDTPIKLELDPQSAPNAVANFIKLANSGFYTNRIMSIDSNRISIKESEDEEEVKNNRAHLSNIIEYPQNDYIYGIKGDFEANGFKNNMIKHRKGTITMLREDYSYYGYAEEGYNSANSVFAILTEDVNGYNKSYASFGYIIDGMDTLNKIAESRVEEEKESTENEEVNQEEEKKEEDEKEDVNVITIKSISVDTFGIDYGIPEYVNYEENIKKVEDLYNQMYGNSSSSNVVTNNNETDNEETDNVEDNGTTIDNTEKVEE